MSIRRQYGCCTLILGICLLAAVLGPTLCAAQPASESQVKAAFIYNFAKFVEWPQTAFAGPSAPIIIGVIGDGAFARSLEETVAGKLINGRAIRVRVLAADGDLKSCHILYVLPTSGKRASGILANVAGASVLTVGESEHFAQIGGIINFFAQDARVRFEINPDAAERAHIKISAKLLALARVVRGISTGR